VSRVAGGARGALRLAGGLARIATSRVPRALAQQVAAHARRTPDATAIVCDDRSWTWRDLDEEASRVAAALRRRGAAAGDTVAIAFGNRPATLFAVAGCARLGIATALLPAGATGAALAHAVDACGPRWIVAGGDAFTALDRLADEVRARLVRCDDDDPAAALGPVTADRPPPVAARDDDVLVYLYTSGTTGLPKAARITVRRFRRFATGFAFAIGRLHRRDVVYLALPLTHATGLIAAWGATVVAGATLVLRPHFSASAFWGECRRFGATVVPYVGETCRYLVAAPPHPDDRRHSVRLFYGAGLRRDVWQAFRRRFGVAEIVEFYGSTEGSVGLVNFEGVPGMIGRLLPRQAVVRVDDDGTPLRDARGRLQRVGAGGRGLLIGRIDRRNRFDGYSDAAASADKILRDPFGDGHDWFSTGDLVRRHPGRWISFADRLGDTFRWKGENVSTTEVENALLRCDGVREAIVYGVEVPGSEGRAGMAAIVTAPGFSLDALAAHVVATLPRHARPLYLRALAAPELTASFKYVKTRLRREGNDPDACGDPLFALDETRGAYVALRPAPASGRVARESSGARTDLLACRALLT
jgi:acyl-CoA synthetase (AMP-forming)/AMP-acid ligase II